MNREPWFIIPRWFRILVMVTTVVKAILVALLAWANSTPLPPS